MQSELIYDIGMNDGSDTAYYLHRGYRVVAVEANPVMAAASVRRFRREIAANRLVVLNVAIAESSHPTPFWICDDRSEWSSFDRANAARDGSAHHEISIQCCRFGDILSEYGTPFYLKIDIEGSDVHCLRELSGRQLPRYVSVEAGDERLLPALSEIGYNQFQCLSQFHFVPVEYPPHADHARLEKVREQSSNPAFLWRMARTFGARHWLRRTMRRARRCGAWAFPKGASGPFGRDLPGKWLSYEDMQRTYRLYQEARARGERSILWNDKDYSFWCDYHATYTTSS
jgi:FkbM family methyltransferase